MDAESTTDGLTLAQHVARAQGTRQRLVDELRDLVAVEQGIYEDLKAQADQAKGRRDGYQRALDHIQGTTVRKALEVLRERELIRVAGRARGGGKLWALMPASPDEGLTVAA
jgi:hypothetical protein